MPTSYESNTLVTYSCPRCAAKLEARADWPFPWLKCPKCQRATAAPELVRARSEFQPFVVGAEDELLVIGEENPYAPASVTTPRPVPRQPTSLLPLRPTGREPGVPGRPMPIDAFGGAEPVSIRRVVLTTVLFISVMMGLFSFLASNGVGTSLAGAVALFCVVLLVVPTRS